MAKYRKIDPRIWNDKKFMAFTDQGKLAFLFGLTHPHMTSIGAMRATIEGLAREIGWEEAAFREAFGQPLAKAMVKADERVGLIWYPNFLKYNKPESPNVIIGWGSALDYLPECDLLSEALQHVKAFVEGLPIAFREAFAKTMLNQEQEQEQE